MSVPGDSLGRRLAGWLCVLLILGSVALWAGSRRSVDTVARDDIDGQLRDDAVLLLWIWRDPGRGGDLSAVPLSSRIAGEAPAYEVRTGSGRLLFGSGDFPEAGRASRLGYVTLDDDGQRWRLYALQVGEGWPVSRVAVTRVGERSRSAALARKVSTPLLWAAIPLSILIALVGIDRGLAPLRRLERAIEAQDPGSLEPLTGGAYAAPREVARLVETINGLIRRVQGLNARRRNFVAFAGHELRTPVAGARAQLDAALQTRDADQRARTLSMLATALGRIEGVIESLLLLARADPDAPDLDLMTFDLGDLLAEVVESGSAARLSLAIEGEQPVLMTGDRDLVRSLVVNLTRNALRAAPPGSVVHVTVRDGADRVEIAVADEGPGLPPAVKRQAFPREPGVRSGHGFGLVLVRAIVRAHGGEIRFEDRPGGGALVTADLPARRPAGGRER